MIQGIAALIVRLFLWARSFSEQLHSEPGPIILGLILVKGWSLDYAPSIDCPLTKIRLSILGQGFECSYKILPEVSLQNKYLYCKYDSGKCHIIATRDGFIIKWPCYYNGTSSRSYILKARKHTLRTNSSLHCSSSSRPAIQLHKDS